MIGQFGEGLKVGALALLRKNLSVFLETSKEIWRFDLVHDDQFGQDVLTVFVTGRILACKSSTLGSLGNFPVTLYLNNYHIWQNNECIYECKFIG